MKRATTKNSLWQPSTTTPAFLDSSTQSGFTTSIPWFEKYGHVYIEKGLQRNKYHQNGPQAFGCFFAASYNDVRDSFIHILHNLTLKFGNVST